MSNFRRRVELQAGPVVVLLGKLPKIVPFLLVFGLLIGGLFAEGVVGAVLLAVLALLMGVLLYLAWPALNPQSQFVRSAVLLVVVVRAATFVL